MYAHVGNRACLSVRSCELTNLLAVDHTQPSLHLQRKTVVKKNTSLSHGVPTPLETNRVPKAAAAAVHQLPPHRPHCATRPQ